MPRFVLLEHRWNGVHWDFMLESGEILRTWAIDAPIVPGVDFPARALVDHRPDYLDYEGDVAGGRGSVRRIDRGEYVTKVWTDDRVEIELSGTQLVGGVALWRVGSGPVETPSLTWFLRLGNRD